LGRRKKTNNILTPHPSTTVGEGLGGLAADPRGAEDILQDVFYELVEANRLLVPIEHVTGWLFRVARNRITDLFRKKKPESFSDTAAGPDALYAQAVIRDWCEREYATVAETLCSGCRASTASY
jgi:DNA-directed RNA polymerase specialized sigma24 family protein